jgi:hypothetical protein
VYRLYLEDEGAEVEIEAVHELRLEDLQTEEGRERLVAVIEQAVRAHEEALTG